MPVLFYCQVLLIPRYYLVRGDLVPRVLPLPVTRPGAI
ncbi:MAG: hypothetical protein OP8BY_1302 [Candidatus Saccharicenans subterraneus]|uniref:Uncharacterized protein n=1 Tax=Candidatus Saccharicenans subterraneus TaxID=2508984 RepID=A0A3E2BPN5_9BACT|nr:MAG: hypothetical protein OP8BY_1302 [Candidatus Saccharicenans subterraneum]